MVEQNVNQEIIDRNLETITKGLTEEQVQQVKKRWSTLQKVSSSEQRIQLIALWIVEHYRKTLERTPFNAMLSTSSKADAISYLGMFECDYTQLEKVIISPPDYREGHEEPTKESNELVQKFLQDMMDTNGDIANSQSTLQDHFVHGEYDTLTVVDKQLNGFE